MIPLLYAIDNTFWAIKHKQHSNMNELISYLNSIPEKKSIYCFSANTTEDCFPLVDETKSTFGSRMPFYWWMQGLIKLEDSNRLSQTIARDKNYFIDAISDDLNHFQTQFIIINTEDTKLLFGNNFNYINYFSNNAKFKAAWSHYHYLTDKGYYQIYRRVS